MSTLNYSDNLISRRWEKKYNEQPKHIQQKLDKLDELDEKNMKEYQLNVIKRTRAYPQKGDVFLIEPRKGKYFYGLVINNHICNIDGDDWLVVFIFKDRASSLTDIDFMPDYNNLLITPCIVGRGYWTRGYFYTIGNRKLDKECDYGFYDMFRDRYVDEYDNEKENEPRLLGIAGVATIYGIEREINEALIIDESLLS